MSDTIAGLMKWSSQIRLSNEGRRARLKEAEELGMLENFYLSKSKRDSVGGFSIGPQANHIYSAPPESRLRAFSNIY